MSTSVSFLIEYFDGKQWQTPLEMKHLFKDSLYKIGVIEICSWTIIRPQTGIFFGKNAPFRLNPGLPPDLSITLMEYVLPNFQENFEFAGWIPIDNLCLKLWNTEKIILSSLVKSKYAQIFGNGKSLFPIKKLISKGMEKSLIQEIIGWSCRVANAPEDWIDKRSYELYRIDPSYFVPVTWVERLSDFAGPNIWDEGLSKLVNLQKPEEYRLVSYIG